MDKRLKGEDSLKRKLAQELHERPYRTPEQALQKMKDSLRYTMSTPPGDYSRSVQQAVADLRARGFEQVKFPDPETAWGDPNGYKGLNTAWRDPDTGHTFELQFHTPESFRAKEATHPMYERIRVLDPSVDSAEIARLEAEAAEIFRQVPVPPDIGSIKSN